MSILITGATGFIGGWLARRLSATEPDTRIRALVRDPKKAAPLEDIGIDVFIGDILDPVAVEVALNGMQRVFHAAGRRSFDQDEAAEIYRTNVEGTRTLLELAQLADVERVVMVSSVFGLGCATDPRRPPDEAVEFNAPELLDIPFVRAKHDLERLAEQMITTGLPLIRVYPGVVYGPGDVNRSSTGLVEQWLQGRLPALLSGGGIGVVDARDVARALVTAMERGTPGRKYLVTGHNTTLQEIFRRMADYAKRPMPPVRLPEDLGVRIAQGTGRLGLFTGMNATQVRVLAYHWWYDCSRARRELGVRFRELDETLFDTVDWLRAHPRET